MQKTDKQTVTEDSGRGAAMVFAGAFSSFVPPVQVFVRHSASELWCGAGGSWVKDRTRGARFSTNLDALIYCEALGICGVIIAFDAYGREMYRLNAESILSAVAATPGVTDGVF